MKDRDRATDRLIRTAAWMYLAPRVALGAVLYTILGLALLVVLLGYVEILLRHLRT